MGDGERRGGGVAIVAVERIEVTVAIGPHEKSPGVEILHRKTKGIILLSPEFDRVRGGPRLRKT
jgi:hypothetical protein